MDRETRAAHHEHKQLKKVISDMEYQLLAHRRVLSSVSNVLQKKSKCVCGQKTTFLFDSDGIVMGEKCSRCPRKWYY